jgi:glycosyltransferase involved in cell wall biosynthesis
MIAALEKAGIDVLKCHVKLWHGIEDRVTTVEGGWKKPAFWWRVVRAYFLLIWRFLKIGDFDILMVGYPGQFDVFLAKIIAILRGKPLVWDVFMSIYLIAKERGLEEEHKFAVSMIRWIEARALRLPDLLIQDTQEYVSWLQKEYGISNENFRLVPTGADDRMFNPSREADQTNGKPCRVLYYGSFIPNHGVMKITEAAELLKSNADVVFLFIGDGPQKPDVEDYIRDHRLTNINLLGWVSQEELIQHIEQADICLGAFGNTPQSLMTVQNKIFECLAMGKPVITGDSPAVRNLLPAGSVVLCGRDDPRELADAILDLKQDSERRTALSQNAIRVFNEYFSITSLGEKLRGYLGEFFQDANKED